MRDRGAGESGVCVSLCLYVCVSMFVNPTPTTCTPYNPTTTHIHHTHSHTHKLIPDNSLSSKLALSMRCCVAAASCSSSCLFFMAASNCCCMVSNAAVTWWWCFEVVYGGGVLRWCFKWVQVCVWGVRVWVWVGGCIDVGILIYHHHHPCINNNNNNNHTDSCTRVCTSSYSTPIILNLHPSPSIHHPPRPTCARLSWAFCCSR